MSKNVKIALGLSLLLVLISIVLAQLITFKSLNTTGKTIETKDTELDEKDKVIKSLERDVRITRAARDDWQNEAEANSNEKVTLNCVQFDLVNEFVALLGQVFITVPQLTPEQRERFAPFTEPVPRPEVCPTL